jgi:SRSO17 transposase
MGLASAETELAKEDVAGLLTEVSSFLKRYAGAFVRSEQRQHAAVYVKGRTRQLPRRTLEPIAHEEGLHRRPLQHFVGAGKWNDNAVRDEMCGHIAKEMGKPNGVLIMDGSGFQKTGPDSVGAQRQWCGRLGKEEMCQVGEFLAYASDGSVTLADCRLYLPKSWATDKSRRAMCHVPKRVTFKKGWRLGVEMVLGRGKSLPHRWVIGDDVYGRATECRDSLHRANEQYVLEVPAATKVRLARDRKKTWLHADRWANSLRASAWEEIQTRDGEKGPIEVRAVKARVYTAREDGRERPEVLVIVRNDRESKSWTYLASDTRASLQEMVRVGACRHGVEEAFTMAKGDVGLDEYEVRSWVGWHHHMSLTMLALWFLVSKQRALKKRPPQSPSRRFVEPWRCSSLNPAPNRTSPISSPSSSNEPRRLDGNIGLLAHNASPRLEPKCSRPMPDSQTNTRGTHLSQFN